MSTTRQSAHAPIVQSARTLLTARAQARRFLALIAPGALLASVLDATFAVAAFVFVLGKYDVVGTLQYIASGLLGDAAFSGGLPAAGLGVLLHFGLAFAFAALYGAVALRRPALSRPASVLVGAAYGVGIWLLMALLVLPAAGVPPGSESPLYFWSFLVNHAVCVGVPMVVTINTRLRARETERV